MFSFLFSYMLSQGREVRIYSPSIEASLPFPEILILAELAAALTHSPELSFIYSMF